MYGILSNCLQYVRYSEDLLVGMVSSRKFAIFIQKKLENFLKSNLHLTVSRYGIIHRDESSVSFLGHTIQLVYFYPKMRAKSKLLEAIYRYKNKVVHRLRLEKYKINRLRVDRFKKRALKHTEVILSELGLKGQKKIEILASLFSYKLLGDILAQSVHFNDLRELIQFLFSGYVSRPTLNSISKKSFSLMDFYLFQDQNGTVINKIFQIYHVKSFKDFHLQKVCDMLKKIQNILKSKARLSTELTLSECVEIKSKQIIQMNTQQTLKNKLSKMISPLLKKEEVCQLLVGGLIDWSLKKQPVRCFSVKANIVKLCSKLRKIGFMHPIKNQASCCLKLVSFSEDDIIRYYNYTIRGILSWFASADNCLRITKIIESIIKYSCWLTLKKKFKLKSIREVRNVYTRSIVVSMKKKCVSRLISRKEIIKKCMVYKIDKNLAVNSVQKYFDTAKVLF